MIAKILVIDDEPSIRSALDRVLRREGYEVLTASGVDTAHAILSETAVDAILLDLRMPKMSGESLYLSIVRRWPSLRGRVILMTGHPYAVEDAWPADLRQCPLLTKPFDLAGLYRVLRSVLDQREGAPLSRDQSG